MACASSSTPAPDAPAAAGSWRPATPADLVPGLATAVGAEPELGVFVDLSGSGTLDLVRIEVDPAAGRARVALVGGPVLGELAPPPAGAPPVTSGLWGHPAGALPERERMPEGLAAFAATHATVEWCVPPAGHPWTEDSGCYGSVIVGLDGGQPRRFEVWD